MTTQPKPTQTAKITQLMHTRAHLPRLLHLLQFGDSALPIGSFSFSSGLESAVQRELVHDLATLHEFVLTVMHQSALSDGIALLCAHDAFEAHDTAALLDIDRSLYERKLNEEMRLMAVRTGRKLCELACAVVGDRLNRDWLARIMHGETPGTHAVSLAIALGALGIARDDAFGVQQYAVATTILGAALRLMRVSFIDTQKILLDVSSRIDAAHAQVADATLDDMASFAPTIDILAAAHVKARVRLFMN